VWLDASAGRALANEISLEFLTGYLIEKALAVDNIFVFLMVFNSFAVPPELRQRALMLGVLGAIALRAVLILLGAALVAQFHWVLYLFGLFLFATGLKMLFAANPAPDLERNPVLGWMRRHLRLTRDFRGDALSVREDGKRWYTPMFVVLVLIAVTDVIFAVTLDPFVVLSSNVFAVLGLRALFFLLAGMADRFHLLGHGLAAVLLFIGAKMLLAGVFAIPIGIALGIVALLIAASIVASLLLPPHVHGAD
jgi:tellurite resistance protein TerC